MLQAGAATVAGAAVATVAGASAAGAQTVGVRTGTVVFAPGERSKDVAVSGLTASSCAFAMQQSPRVAKVGSATPVLVAHPDRNTGLVTIEINDDGNRFWSVTVAWQVVG